MSVTGHKETIDHVEPLEELLEGLAVEAFEEMLCQFLVGFSSVNAPTGFEACAPAVRPLFAAHFFDSFLPVGLVIAVRPHPRRTQQ